MARFFISYSHVDRLILDEIISPLRLIFGQDSLWFDDDLKGQGGANWWTNIKKEIQECSVFVYLLSDTSTVSKWCEEELSEAIRKQKKILPVVIGTLTGDYPGKISSHLAEILSKTQFVDMRKEVQAGLNLASLISSATNLLKVEKIIALSKKERWMLSNQYRILSKVDPDNSDSYDKACEILENGYELHYQWISQYLYEGDEIMSHGECLEVFEILDMFSELQHAYRALQDTSGVDEVWIHFPGFDGNKETKQLSYVRFLIEKDEKFGWIERETGRHDGLNSHWPLLTQYRVMLQEFKNSLNPRKLTRDDLIRITTVPDGLE